LQSRAQVPNSSAGMNPGYLVNGLASGFDAMMPLLQMYYLNQQSMQPEEVAQIQYFKPFLAFLDTTSEATRREIFKAALAKEPTNNVNPVINFCNNAFKVANEKNLIPVELQKEMSASLLKQASQVTGMSFKSILANGVSMGIAFGIMDCMKRLMSESLSRVVNKIPGVFSFMGRLASKGYNKLSKRPDPLTAEEIIIWEHTLEGLLNSLCEQNTSGNLMLKNMRVEEAGEHDQQQQIVDTNWTYYVSMVHDICVHVTVYLSERLPYYTGQKDQRQFFVSIANGVSMENKNSIAFMMTCIMKNLENLINTCKRAENADELDINHVKKLGRITLLLFKKLRVMIEGNQSGSSSSYAEPMRMGYGQSGITDH
jgi:hypothetical protein